MAFRIDERFQVPADADAVFAFLVDAPRVVTCLPGAQLTEAIDARNFRGAMKVKLGPVTVAYQGKVSITELDAAARRVKLTGEGKEGGGAGSARMTMETVASALPGGETEVAVRADVDVAGRAVQLGRGMMEPVAAQLVKQFAASLRTAMAAAGGLAGSTGPAATGAPAAAPPQAEPLRAFPLLLRAAWAALLAFFRRLLGRPARR